MVITCTYHTNLDETFDFDETKFKASIERSVSVAKAACENSDKPCFVIGSVGTYAQSFGGGHEFNGIFPKVDAIESAEERDIFYRDFHRPRLDALMTNPDVDVIGVETVPRIDEAVSITKLLNEICTKPFYVSLCGGQKSDKTLNSGESLTDCITAIQPYFKNELFWAVGINCVPLASVDGQIVAINESFKQF